MLYSTWCPCSAPGQQLQPAERAGEQQYVVCQRLALQTGLTTLDTVLMGSGADTL